MKSFLFGVPMLIVIALFLYVSAFFAAHFFNFFSYRTEFLEKVIATLFIGAFPIMFVILPIYYFGGRRLLNKLEDDLNKRSS